MQHIMNKEEVTEAIHDFLEKNGINIEGKHVGIVMAPGGKEAKIEISNEPIKQKRASRKSATSKPTPEKEPETPEEEAVIVDEDTTKGNDASEENLDEKPEEETSDGDTKEDDDDLFGGANED